MASTPENTHTAPLSEKEKMRRGLPYDANYDEKLKHERRRCKQLCYEYNHAPFAETARREALLRQILGHAGQNLTIEPDFQCDYGYNISVGENFYANHNCVILDPAPVTFGDNVFIGPNCGFYTAAHPLAAAERNRGIETARPIAVGNNVWIGGNVCVLPGVSIGSNSVIGAGSVVTKDIPENVIAVGNPCRVVRKL